MLPPRRATPSAPPPLLHAQPALASPPPPHQAGCSSATSTSLRRSTSAPSSAWRSRRRRPPGPSPQPPERVLDPSLQELLLLNPMAYIHHLRYAEILLTLGGIDKGGNADLVRTARAHRPRGRGSTRECDDLSAACRVGAKVLCALARPQAEGQPARAVRAAPLLRRGAKGAKDGRRGGGARRVRAEEAARGVRRGQGDVDAGHRQGDVHRAAQLRRAGPSASRAWQALCCVPLSRGALVGPSVASASLGHALAATSPCERHERDSADGAWRKHQLTAVARVRPRPLTPLCVFRSLRTPAPMCIWEKFLFSSLCGFIVRHGLTGPGKTIIEVKMPKKIL